MIEESVAFLVGQGKEVVYDAEHFFDAYQRPPRVRARLPPGGRGRRRAPGSRRATPTAATLPARVAAIDGGRARRAAGRGARHPHAQRRRVRASPTAWRRSRRAPGWCRARSTATASAAATPTWSRSSRRSRSRWASTCSSPSAWPSSPSLSNFVAETANLQPDSWAPYVGRNAFAHKGGMHQQGMNADARSYEHVDPDAGRQRPPGAGVRAVGARDDRRQGAGARHRRRGRPRAHRRHPGAAQGAGAPGLPLRGGRRLVRAAGRARDRRSTSRSSRSRASA